MARLDGFGCCAALALHAITAQSVGLFVLQPVRLWNQKNPMILHFGSKPSGRFLPNHGGLFLKILKKRTAAKHRTMKFELTVPINSPKIISLIIRFLLTLGPCRNHLHTTVRRNGL